MNKLYLVSRSTNVKKILCPINTSCKEKYFEKSTTAKDTSSSSSSSSSDSDIDVKKLKSSTAQANTSHQQTLNKLNNLLKKIIEEDVVQPEKKLDLAKPTNKRIKKKSEEITSQSVEKQVAHAVKDVAQDIGGNVEQTESELLLKLLGPSEPQSSLSLSDIMKGMKIDRELKPVEQSRADQVRTLLQRVKPNAANNQQIQRKQRKPVQLKQKPEMVVQNIDLFGSEPLRIFTNTELKESWENKTWQSLYQRDLKLAVTNPPANYFQQMILWTEQGKLWKFPIDNEQDLEEEKKVYFTEHIFLEELLESWCPPKGPIRHFMELVCVGLSKNSYLSVKAKKDHIEWYKNYFEEKKKLLQEVGAIVPQKDQQKALE